MTISEFENYFNEIEPNFPEFARSDMNYWSMLYDFDNVAPPIATITREMIFGYMVAMESCLFVLMNNARAFSTASLNK